MDNDESPTNSPQYSKNYDSVAHNYHKESHTRRNVLIVVVILVLLLGGASGYWFFVRKKPASNNAASTQNSKTSQTAPATKINPKTKTYESTNFSLSLDYPEDWAISDATGSGKLIATSPSMQLKDANNQQVTGQIVLMIRDPGQKLSEFDSGNALAVRDSEKIAYAKPSVGQRGSTYISFLAYSGAESTVLDGIYVTGDSGYTKGQAIPAVDIAKVNPIITITFTKCVDTSCSGTGAPLSVVAASWDDADAGPLKSLLESLVIN